MKKALGASIAVLALTLFAVSVSAVSESASPEATTTILQTCGITASSPIAFGSLIPGGTSGDVTSTISMPLGNFVVTPTVEGTQWTEADLFPPPSMPVGATHWSLSDVAYGAMTELSGSATSLGDTVSFGDPLGVHFKLSVPAGTPASVYKQTITFTATC